MMSMMVSFLSLTSRGLAAAAAGGAGLADLALDELLDVLDALALVRLGAAQLTHHGRGLPEQIAVGARECDAVLVDLGRHALRQLEHHRVRVAERHGHGIARDLGAITDAVDLELARPAFGHALDHVGEVRAHEAVLRAVLVRIVRSQHDDLVGFGLERHAGGHRLAELALRSLDAESARLLRECDALGERYWFSSDT